MSSFGLPRWAILVAGAALLLVGLAVSQGWIRDPAVAKSDYVGTIDVSTEDARLYRAVPFEWQVTTTTAGTIKGNDTAYVRIDPSGEKGLLCGWLRLDKGGASIRATRWMSEARIRVGGLLFSALFVAPTDKQPGDDLNAGCARLLDDKPAADSPMSFEGSPVRE